MRHKQPWPAWPERPAPRPEASATGLLRLLLEVSGQHSGDYRVTNPLTVAHDRLRRAIDSRDLDAIRSAMDGARDALRQCAAGPGPRTVA